MSKTNKPILELPPNEIIFECLKAYKDKNGRFPPHGTQFAPEGLNWDRTRVWLLSERDLTFGELYAQFDQDFIPQKRHCGKVTAYTKPTSPLNSIDVLELYNNISCSITQENLLPTLANYRPAFEREQVDGISNFFQKPADKTLLPRSPEEFIFALGLTDRFGNIAMHLVDRDAPVTPSLDFHKINEDRASAIRHLQKWERQNQQWSFEAA